MISRLYILSTTSRLKGKYIFQKHLGELYFLNLKLGGFVLHQ